MKTYELSTFSNKIVFLIIFICFNYFGLRYLYVILVFKVVILIRWQECFNSGLNIFLVP